MPAVTIGQAGLVFGLNTETVGVVQSFSETRNIEKNEIRDETGNVKAVAYYNPTTAYSLSVAVTGTQANSITVGGSYAMANATTAGTLRIDSLAIGKSNSAFVTLDISATGYPNVS